MDSEVKQVGFQPGNKLGRGRPPKLKTQVKDFIKEHPYAIETLMKTLYDMGIKGDREACMYLIDRVKGKPKAILGIDEEDRDLLKAATVVEFFKLMDKGRENAIQGQGEAKQLQQGQDEEGSG